MAGKRQSVEVSPETLDLLGRAGEWSGQSKKIMVQRVLDWFLQQPQNVQGAILMSLPESMQPDFARIVLELMTHENQPTSTGQPVRPRLVARSAKPGNT